MTLPSSAAPHSTLETDRDRRRNPYADQSDRAAHSGGGGDLPDTYALALAEVTAVEPAVADSQPAWQPALGEDFEACLARGGHMQVEARDASTRCDARVGLRKMLCSSAPHLSGDVLLVVGLGLLHKPLAHFHPSRLEPWDGDALDGERGRATARRVDANLVPAGPRVVGESSHFEHRRGAHEGPAGGLGRNGGGTRADPHEQDVCAGDPCIPVLCEDIPSVL